MNTRISVDTCTFVKSGCDSEQFALAEIACFSSHFNPNVRADDVGFLSINLAGHYSRKRYGLFNNLFEYTLPEDLISKEREVDLKACHMRFTAQGKAMKTLSLEQQFAFIQDMVERGWRPTRIDVPLDILFETSEGVSAFYLKFIQPYQHYKSNGLTLKGVELATVHDSISGSEYVRQQTVFGSPKSQSYLVVYNKDLESSGDYKALRFEYRFKSEKASQLGQLICKSNSDVFTQLLAGIIGGSIGFGDSNREIAPFWQCALDSIPSAPISLPLPRAHSTIRSKLQWLKRQVAGSLAYIYKIVGEGIFNLIINKLIKIGHSQLNEQKLMEVDYYTHFGRTLTTRAFMQELGIVLPSSRRYNNCFQEPVRVSSIYQ